MKYEFVHLPCAQNSSLDHVEYTTRCSTHDVLTVVQFSDILAEIGAANAHMALHVHHVSQSQNNFLDLHSQLASG